jgi:orotidine-5'-phosphate decarboxylase
VRLELAPRDARDRLIVALDVETVEAARTLVRRIGESASFYKVGMQLAFAGGLSLLPELKQAGKRVFLDMKLLDIDNTVSGAVASLARLEITFTTIHAYPKSMRAAVAARDAGGPGLLAVTVLTSLDDADLQRAGYRATVAELAAQRAADARDAGMDGLVCSPQEVSVLRRIVGPDLAIVTPGIRPRGSESGDQKRLSTPADAIAAGADYLVVGRPITAAADPGAAAAAILQEIEAAL